MKRPVICALLLALLFSFSACGKEVREESGEGDLHTYRLPTEWTVTEDGKTKVFTVAYEGSTATVTREDGMVLSFTVDPNGNVISRENADGSALTAVYDGDGRLAETLLRDANGAAKQRTVYDADGNAVREYTRGRFDEVTLREFTYGGDGRLTGEAKYGSYRAHTYEYHENGERSAETVYLLDTLPYYRHEFDENGNLTWEISYDKDGNVSYRCAYDAEGNIAAEYDADGSPYVRDGEETIYDENGNPKAFYRYNEDGTLYERYEYDYDEAGNEIAWRHYDSDGTLSREVFRSFDEAGVLKKAVMKDYRLSTGELLDTTEMEYDEAGNQTVYTAYDGEGNLSSRTEMTYESIGGAWHMIRRVVCDGEGNLWLREELTYDEKGNNTSEVTYSADGSLAVRIESTYDERGNRIEAIRSDGDGNLLEREVCAYDEQNNPLEWTLYEGEERVSHIAYENNYAYDGEGRPISGSLATVEARYTYTYEEGSGLRKETCTDGDGNVVHVRETVIDGNGNPRIEQKTLQRSDGSYEKRYEYTWGEDGGLLSRIRYSGKKEVLSKLETGGHIDHELTEAQYRQLLTLLFDTADGIFIEYVVPDIWEE